MKIKQHLFKPLLILFWLLILIVEANLAWPVLSLAIWLRLISQVSKEWQIYLILSTALILSVVWPMSVLLSIIICLLMLILVQLSLKLISQTNLVFLLASWLIFLPASWYFKLAFSLVNLGQLIISLLLVFLVRRSLLFKFKKEIIVFE